MTGPDQLPARPREGPPDATDGPVLKPPGRPRHAEPPPPSPCSKEPAAILTGHPGKGADLDADLSVIHTAVDSTGPWLAIWEARREPDAFARRCAADAIDAIDAALAALHRIRGQLVTEAARADDEAARADDDEPGGDETYHCPECGSLAGMFIGRQGWWHYTGTGTTADPVVIFDPGHQATPAADALLDRAGGRDDG